MMHMTPELLERMAQQRVLKLSEGVAYTLKEHYPKACRVMGDTQLKKFCETCAKKAYDYGAETYGELKTYTHMAWILGIGFDDDPLYPWIQELLTQEEPFEYRLEALAEKIEEIYYFNTYEELQVYQEALSRLLTLNFADIKTFTSYTDIVNTLESIYPQRVEALGGKAVFKERLKQACYKKTIRYNIDHSIGIFVYAGLVFFLGHRVDDDPLYGWAKKYLNDDEPRMAYKLDKLVKVIEKRVRHMHRDITLALKELK